MDVSYYARFEAIVDECVKTCLGADQPYVALTAFVENLQAEGWSAREVIKLHTRVIRTLLFKQL